jgi:uncharacterized ubiquitin-like protein YukD
MRLLLLSPGKIPASKDEIFCFTDVWAYYLSTELSKQVKLTTLNIPGGIDNDELTRWFENVNIDNIDAVLVLGLRYFSKIPKQIGEAFRQRLYPKFLCQIHDGSRLDNDPVDINFTLKDESEKYYLHADANRFVRHRSHNAYIGWAADPDLNFPAQDKKDLRILVDHTNYGDNPIDLTMETLQQIRKFVSSKVWKMKFTSVSVRRFDSGKIVDVDLDNLIPVEKYDRTSIPLSEICKEHSRAHIFCVTHPESVGQVVLETAMAGAFCVSPKGFIPPDRLKTVRFLEWEKSINWKFVLPNINPALCRETAIENSWEKVAKRIKSEIAIRTNIRSMPNG